MTENEAIEVLTDKNTDISTSKCDDTSWRKLNPAVEAAISALEEIQQYRALGTVEQCQKSVEIVKAMIERNITPEIIEEYMKFEDECVRKGFSFNSLLEAREKQRAKKVLRSFDEGINQHWCSCPVCAKGLGWSRNNIHFDYCPNCGQAIDWEGWETIDGRAD